MRKAVAHGIIKQFRKSFIETPKYRMAQNALSQVELKALSLNFERVKEMSHLFSHVVEGELAITHQHKSGRCWIFAGLNILRIPFAKAHKLEKFEFSQSYLFFWDKLEKANYFLENILETANEPHDSRLMMYLLDNPLQDGGQWHMLVSLIEKYGLLPQSAFPDMAGSLHSKEMNYRTTLKLRENAARLRDMVHKGAKPAELRAKKEEMLEEIYRILCMHLGTPPETFTWEFYTKDKKFHRYPDLTPREFYEKHVKVDLSDYICLVHSPRKATPYYKSYTVAYLGNVIEGTPICYVNVPIEELRQKTTEMLQKGHPVWFGCDVLKSLHREKGVMDLKLYDAELIYDVPFQMTKEMRMNYGESTMTHAMVFTGVNLVENEPTRFRVENSWGDALGEKGYFLMTTDWFDAYMFEVVIHKQFLSKKILEIAKEPPHVLDPWDPLGALA